MSLVNWKLDASLRDCQSGEVEVAVQPLASASAADLERLRAFGLAPPATAGGLWRGRLPAEQLATLASLAFVGYIHDASAPPTSSLTRPRRPTLPPRPARRGHTKLPPRRA